MTPRRSADWCAWARQEQLAGRPERAEAGFRQALNVDPSSLPAHFGLASVLLDRGDADGADGIATHMAAAAGDRPDVLWLQARIAQARGDAPKAGEVLSRLLADARISDAQRAEALLMLGLILSDQGRGRESFSATARGKELQRALHAPEAERREGEVAKLRRLGTWMAGEKLDWHPLPLSQVPSVAASHAFLLGFPRSGTTLLENVLTAHPRVVALEEAPTLATPYQAFLSDANACDTLMHLSGDEAEAWIGHYWTTVRECGADVSGRLFIDKQPAGTLNLPIIARLFPRAKILFAIRDPRDVVLSCFRQAFQINAMTYAFTDLAQTAACYDACMELAATARARLPLEWMDVRHEAMVEDFDAELRRIVDFLGLAPDPAMADFARLAATRTIRTPSATQVRAGLNRRGLGRWQHFRDELAPVLPMLTPWVERFGYQP